MCDSDDDLSDDAGRSSIFGRPGNKVPEEIMVSAASLKAEREKFWDVHNKLEELQIAHAPVNAGGIGECVKANEETQIDHESMDVDKLLPGSNHTIQLLHPGRNILNQVDTNTSFSSELFLFENCKLYCDSPYSRCARRLHEWSVEQFHNIILQRNITEFDTYAVEDRHILCKNLFFLMAMDKNEDVNDACYDILAYYGANWNPSLQNLLNVFIIWGIPAELLLPEDLLRDTMDNLLQSAPGINPTENNICRVLDHLCALFTEAILHDCHRAGLLLRALLLTTLDRRFRCSLVMHKFKTCVALLLNHIDASDWTDEKISELCKMVYFGDEHFHNQAFICTALLDTSARTRHVQHYLTTRLVEDLVLERDKQSNSRDCWNLPSIVELLVENKLKIFGLDEYSKYTLLNVVYSYVGNYKISANDYRHLEQLVDWIGQFSSNVKSDVTNLDVSMIKGLISRIAPHWKSMLGQKIYGLDCHYDM